MIKWVDHRSVLLQQASGNSRKAGNKIAANTVPPDVCIQEAENHTSATYTPKLTQLKHPALLTLPVATKIIQKIF